MGHLQGYPRKEITFSKTSQGQKLWLKENAQGHTASL